MLRELVATGIVFAIGYAIGAIFGFRAAVTDYVENDAEQIESVADDIYSSGEEGENLPQAVSEALEGAKDESGTNSQRSAFE